MATVTRDAKHPHIRYIDHGHTVEAVAGGDPANDGTDKELRDGRHIVASIQRVYAYEGAGWWGYILNAPEFAHHCPLENTNKADAMRHLRAEVAEHADFYREV